MYGDAGLKLVQHAKRTLGLPHLPPYQTELVRNITREVRELDGDVNALLLPFAGSFNPAEEPATACALLVNHLSMRRNKRCLLAYHRVRSQRLEQMCWNGEDVMDRQNSAPRQQDQGPQGADASSDVGSLSPEEEEYVRQYADLLAAFKGQWTDIDLTGSIEPPRDLFIDVRVLKDAGEIQTEYGVKVMWKLSRVTVHGSHLTFQRQERTLRGGNACLVSEDMQVGALPIDPREQTCNFHPTGECEDNAAARWASRSICHTQMLLDCRKRRNGTSAKAVRRLFHVDGAAMYREFLPRQVDRSRQSWSCIYKELVGSSVLGNGRSAVVAVGRGWRSLVTAADRPASNGLPLSLLCQVRCCLHSKLLARTQWPVAGSPRPRKLLQHPAPYLGPSAPQLRDKHATDRARAAHATPSTIAMSGLFPRLRSGSTSSAMLDSSSQDPPASYARPIGASRTAPIASSSAPLRDPSPTTPQTLPPPVHPGSLHSQTLETAWYSSHGVREETAQIASWALKNELPQNLDAAVTDPSSSPSSDIRRKSSASFLADGDRLRRGSTVPESIQEVSEPPTPDEDAVTISQSHRSSILADQIRERDTQSSAPTSSADMLPSLHAHFIPSEATPLLPKPLLSPPSSKPAGDLPDVEGQPARPQKRNQLQQILSAGRARATNVIHIVFHPKSWDRSAVWEKGIKQPIGLLPCVFLGLLLNVLDALSYGMILFPLGEQIFEKTGSDGISMFYISCIVSQLVYSCGGSIFKGAVGSEMIEVVPFFHKMTYTIMARTGTSRPEVVLATTITSYAMSSILTGIVFFLLGCFKLGSLVSFFPRHILIGCIGGVGFFLFVTGIEVSARLDGSLSYDLPTAKKLFSGDTILLWVIPLLLSVLLLIVKRLRDAPWVVPAFFVSIAAIFYIVILAVPTLNLELMRESGWIFKEVAASEPFYHFYSYYDFAVVDWTALASTIPAMFALTFFGILHVPINVPALAIAAEEDDLNLNRELVAHGLSNALSGCVGSIQNYLVYVNSEMFIHNGGNSRLAGILLAAATFGVLVAGPGMIGFVPIMVVGALIFYLGIALLEEALVDTWGKMNRLEYLTVLAIVLIMGVYDFVAGIFAGILLACLNFVVQTSQKSAIRATYSGEVVESTVRRHPVQRHFLREVGYQTIVTKLAGYLFFGSIVQVEKQSRALIEEEVFQHQAIRYLIFDLAHVNGIDYSAVEAFTRMERILGRRDVRMVVSGVERESDVGKSLRNVGLWQDDSAVEFFENLNAALEFCENELLKAFYRQRDVLRSGVNSPTEASQTKSQGSLDIPGKNGGLNGMGGVNALSSSVGSPRQRFLKEAATTTLNQPTAQHSLHPPKRWASYKQPLPLILQTFHELTSQSEDFWHRALPFFSRRADCGGHHVRRAAILQRDEADCNGQG
ncbi:hypothetical protein FH972_022103 [Carpinus fangiana]|uniref:DNA replication complex GINS protein PSF1 n=1 Tax=Carpinus fangiana TaxID=176857 RepID=A0A5N6KRL9_9ROSI|nr:hypothetical protein FH972_022103 [Carpinus fangiana]